MKLAVIWISRVLIDPDRIRMQRGKNPYQARRWIDAYSMRNAPSLYEFGPHQRSIQHMIQAYVHTARYGRIIQVLAVPNRGRSNELHPIEYLHSNSYRPSSPDRSQSEDSTQARHRCAALASQVSPSSGGNDSEVASQR